MEPDEPIATSDESLVIAKQIIAAAVLWREGSQAAAETILVGLPHPDTLGVLYGMWHAAIEQVAELMGINVPAALQDIALQLAEADAGVDEDVLMAAVRERAEAIDPFARLIRIMAENGWHDASDDESNSPEQLIVEITDLVMFNATLMGEVAKVSRQRDDLQAKYETLLAERNLAIRAHRELADL